jgi:hypothetical protein
VVSRREEDQGDSRYGQRGRREDYWWGDLYRSEPEGEMWKELSLRDAGRLGLRANRTNGRGKLTRQHLFERLWIFLTESLLAMTIFRDDFSVPFAIMFGILVFLRCFHWITADRVDYVSYLVFGITSTFQKRKGRRAEGRGQRRCERWIRVPLLCLGQHPLPRQLGG